ncbi:MAG: P27 family phage terminase small subunit [Bacteroidota bacterium]
MKKLIPNKNLSRRGKQIFRQIADHLGGENLLGTHNKFFIDILAAEIEMYELMEVAPEDYISPGQKGSEVINPILRERRGTIKTILSIAREFGLTPKSLHSMGMLRPSDDVPKDPVADMMMKRAKMKVV